MTEVVTHAEAFCEREIDRLKQFLQTELGISGQEGTPVVDTAIDWIKKHNPPLGTGIDITQLLVELEAEYCRCGPEYTTRHLTNPDCESCQTMDLRRDAATVIKQLIDRAQGSALPANTEAVHIMSYREFEQLVKKELGFDYNFVAFQECGNDVDFLFTVRKGNAFERYYPGQTLGPQTNVYDVLEALANKGVLAEGKYLIQVSW